MNDYTNGFFIFLILIVSVVIILKSRYLFRGRKGKEINYERKTLENLMEYTENLEQLYSEMCKFRHDYMNIISSISAFIVDKDINGLEEYFNNNIYSLNSKKYNYTFGLLKNIHLQEVKGLISSKVIAAKKLGIDVIIDIADVIEDISMDKIDLIRSLGIILDNAIEAAVDSSIKKVSIALIKKEKSIVIVVANTYEGEILPMSKIFEPGISTKGKNRGIGLSNLKEIIARYKNVLLDTYINKGEFVQEIWIGNK